MKSDFSTIRESEITQVRSFILNVSLVVSLAKSTFLKHEKTARIWVFRYECGPKFGARLDCFDSVRVKNLRLFACHIWRGLQITDKLGYHRS